MMMMMSTMKNVNQEKKNIKHYWRQRKFSVHSYWMIWSHSGDRVAALESKSSYALITGIFLKYNLKHYVT